MGTGKVGNLTRAGVTGRRTAVLTVLGAAVVVGALLFPLAAPAHDASDFFVFAKASFGSDRKSNETDCDASNDKQADVSGSGSQIHGRIHSNADVVASSGATNTFHNEITYGTHDEDCQEQSENTNFYNAGQPGDIDSAPTGVNNGWPGDLDSYLTSGLTFSTVEQALPGETCDIGSLSDSSDYVINPVADNGKVICRGSGKITLSESGATMSVTMLSHGIIEVSGQNATLTPAAHGILAFSDLQLDSAIKFGGSNFQVPQNSIVFAPQGGIDTSGSDDAEMCIQLIGQGPIKVPGSNSTFGPGSAACTAQPPNVSVVKEPNSQTIDAGQPATFSITVTNNGPGSSDVTLTDNLPVGSGGLDWSEASDPSNSCSVSALPANPQVLSCNFGTLTSGASRTVSVTTQTEQADCAVLNNTVNITASGDQSSENNTDNGQITIQCPDVSVTKVGNGTITAGAFAEFTMVITNNGPGAVTGVGLTDNLPGTGWSIFNQTAAACSVDGGGDNLTCTGINLAQGGQYNVTVRKTTAAPADCGPMQNTVNVTAPNDPNTANNTANATVTVDCPDISVTKEGNGPITAGDTAEFTMVITNNGPGTANGVSLNDALPGTGWSIFNQTAANCSVTGGTTLTCSGITLLQGGQYNVTVRKTTAAPANCGELQNTVTVAATNEGQNTANNTANATIVVNCPDISVTKEGNGPITAGAFADFTMVITNNGPGTATGVGLTDNLPGTGWSILNQTAANCSVDGGGDNLTCSGITLAMGATYSVTVRKTTSAANCGTLENTVNVSATNEGQNTANNTANASIVVNCPDISVTKEGNGTITAGGIAEFTMVITNNGPGTATGVGLTDNLPGTGWSVFSQTAANCSVDGTGDNLTCSGIELAQGATYSVVVRKTTAAPADCGPLQNTVNVSATNEGTNRENNTANATVTVNCPDISVTKQGNGPISAGAAAEFTILITNNGPGTATGVAASDTLAGGGWSIFSQTAANCSLDGAGAVLTCSGIELAQGASYSVVVRKTTSNANCGTIPNTVTVSATNEGTNQQNNTANASIVVNCPDITVTKDGNGPVDAGDVAQFAIVITNTGPGTATGVGATDNLLGGGWTILSQTAANCSLDGAGAVLTCSGITLAENATYTVVVRKTTTAADCGTIPNRVDVTANNENPGQLENNKGLDSIDVLCGEIIIEKQTLPDGDQQLFDFDASYDEGGFSLGDGDQDESGDLEPGSYTVSENVPEGWDLTDIDCGEENVETEGSEVFIDLDAGETVTCVFENTKRGSIVVEKQTSPDGAAGSFTFTGDAAGSIGDNGQIVVDDLEPDTYTSTEGLTAGFNLTGISCDDENSSGSLATRTATFELDPGETVTCTFTNTQIPTLTGQGSIDVQKSATPTSVKEPGGLVDFTVTIRNTSTVNVTIMEVHDSVFGDLDDLGGSGVFDVPINLAPGESVSKTFQRQVNGVGGQAHVNVVTASGVDEFSNPVSDSDDARVDITERLIDLVIVKTATSPTPLNGIVNYTMTVTNKGPDTATNVQLADPAPAAITYLTVNPSQGTCNLTPSLITCSLGTIAPNQTVTIAVTARATQVGTHTNVATVTGGGGRETNPADNVDDAVTVVPQPLRPPTVDPAPEPQFCLTLTVTPKMIKADGKADRVTVKVTAGKKRMKGTKVSIFGAGVKKTARSNAKGIAVLRINPRRAGLITITAIETNQKVCGPKRIGVVGVFLPPLTG
jgi:uncharacterized repeat protein (TIGR01451 family)